LRLCQLFHLVRGSPERRVDQIDSTSRGCSPRDERIVGWGLEASEKIARDRLHRHSRQSPRPACGERSASACFPRMPGETTSAPGRAPRWKENAAGDVVRTAPHPNPLPASGEREGPAKREGEGQRARSVRRFSREGQGPVPRQLFLYERREAPLPASPGERAEWRSGIISSPRLRLIARGGARERFTAGMTISG
jgi:hypothetical protein